MPFVASPRSHSLPLAPSHYSSRPSFCLNILTYSFHVISISCRPFFTFSIDGHNLTVIELDGVEHDPVTVQNIDIYAGTVDLLVK
jgi:FtsP/CotA-like multicopper oxidase with cupredoxin domain